MSSQTHWSVVAPSVNMSRPMADSWPATVLVVDPIGDNQVALAPVLSAQGTTLYFVQTAAEAWQVLAEIRPDIIVLEAVADAFDGFELGRQLKRSLPTRRTPILFVGAGHDKRDRLQAFEVGGVDFIAKPYWPEEVAVRLQVHLSTGRLHQRVQHHTRQSLGTQGHFPLLANLQRTLHQQAVKLQEKNAQLQREVQERQLVEQALRQEQQKSERLLLNILPEAIVDQLKQFHGSLAERFDEATVLFADIVNFTPLAAQVSPLELVNLLNQIFSTFDRLAEKHQLEKIKTIGDAYMVVGGVPTPQPHHAIAVAEMALEMQTAIRDFQRQSGESLQLRIGINTGSVVAGVIGIKKFSYDLWGDTVNVASRMESQGTPDKIQVTASTYQQLQAHFLFEPAQEIVVKGKGPMSTYYLLGRRSVETSTIAIN